MEYKCIEVRETFDGQVVEIVLGPPPGNIVSMDLIREVATELKRLDNDEPENRSRRLIVFTGNGKHFSYGASVEEHKASSVGEMLPIFHSLVRQIFGCRIPTMAKVSGLCLGGGFEIALACSMILCTEDAKFGVPEIKLGVFPPAASVLLPWKTGDSTTCEMIFTGGTYPASEMHRLGIVNSVTATGSLDDLVADFVQKQILPKSAAALRMACEAARFRSLEFFDTNIKGVEKLYLEKLMATNDAVEGIEAFLAKRDPKWADA